MFEERGWLAEASSDGPGDDEELLAPYRITSALLVTAPTGARLNPCPPFLRGVEVSADVIAHPAFVRHTFKTSLLPVRRAVVAFCPDRG